MLKSALPALPALFLLTALLAALLFLSPASVAHLRRALAPRPAPPQSDPPSLHPAIPPAIADDIPLASVVHRFTVPHPLSYYADTLPPAAPPGSDPRTARNRTRLYLVTAGIMMRVSARFLPAVACLVANHVYPAHVFSAEVLQCDLPRLLTPGEPLSVVLRWDARLQQAAASPRTLHTGVVAEIAPSDLARLPSDVVFHANLTGADPRLFRVSRSELVVASASRSPVASRAHLRPRYRLCLMTMIKPNAHMLKDWADYHRRIGVDQVYIFDNGADRDLRAMFRGRLDVEIVDWPFHKAQIQAVSMFLFAGRSRCERAMLEDSDEYPMFGLGNASSLTTSEPPLIRYARQAEQRGFLNYKLLHLVIVNSGFLHRPAGEVPLNYIHRHQRQTFQNGKSVCHMDLEWQSGAIHSCGEVNGKKPRIYKLNISAWGDVNMTPEQPDDPPFLMHFRDRSWEEYIAKWDAGRVAGKLVNDERAGSMSMDHPDELYMKVDPAREYTHFRDKIYRRVLEQGTLDQQTVVQTVNGKRCETLYKIENGRRRKARQSCL